MPIQMLLSRLCFNLSFSMKNFTLSKSCNKRNYFTSFCLSANVNVSFCPSMFQPIWTLNEFLRPTHNKLFFFMNRLELSWWDGNISNLFGSTCCGIFLELLDRMVSIKVMWRIIKLIVEETISYPPKYVPYWRPENFFSGNSWQNLYWWSKVCSPIALSCKLIIIKLLEICGHLISVVVGKCWISSPLNLEVLSSRKWRFQWLNRSVFFLTSDYWILRNIGFSVHR